MPPELETPIQQDPTPAGEGVMPRIAFVLLAVILIIAPLFRAGRVPLALMALELLAAALLVVTLWQAKPLQQVNRYALFAILFMLLLYLLYLIPLPPLLSALLPRYALHTAVNTAVFGSATTPQGLFTASVVPGETFASLMVLLLSLAVFIATSSLNGTRRYRLVILLLWIAGFEAALGLMQYGQQTGPLFLGMERSFGSGTGTYPNRDHLVGLLEMVLPISLGLFAVSATRKHRSKARGRLRQHASFLNTLKGQKAVVYAFLTFLLLLGIVFTKSRTGIALTIVAVLLSMPAFSTRIGGDNSYGKIGTIVAIALGLAIMIGLAPILDRFSADQLTDDTRMGMYSATLEGIGALLPLGSGPGSFSSIFPAFQTLDLGKFFIDHTHNDYLEWFFEWGILLLPILLLLLIAYVRQWPKVWQQGKWSKHQFAQVGAGIGILLLALHSLIDYNLHIPANIIYFAFLAGIFLAPPEIFETAVQHHRHRSHHKHQSSKEKTEPEVPPQEKPQPTVADQIKNPFLDE